MRANQIGSSKERGSALLASLMVMVGLTLLGLAFVTISETEGAISVNQRNLTQVQQVAETGAKFVVEWFQDPDWATAQGLMPANTSAIKPVRTYLASGTPSTDQYKETSGTKLFDTPHRPARRDRLFGTEAKPDVVINGSTNQTFLNTLNSTLFGATGDVGRITDIRVYAPPMMAGVVNADGYYESGTRLGLATVQVTATKCRDDSATTPCSSTDSADRIIAQKTVRAVLTEWPFPGPAGPIQTNANLGTNGNFQVHWGMITATGAMDLKRPFAGLPYHDAYNKTHFEYGYVDPSVGVVNNPWVHDAAATDFKKRHPWIHELVNKAIQDPWWNAWSRGDASWDGDGAGGTYFPARWDDPADVFGDIVAQDACKDACRSIFQFQENNVPPDQRSVLFPRMDYDFWKDVARAGDDQDTVFYLQWVSGDIFRDRNGTPKSFEQWVDTAKGAIPGFYFFDTKDGTNPQNVVNPTNLTPAIKPKLDGPASGFIYLNSEMWDGAGGPGGNQWYPMPGEPYRDIGYRKARLDGTDWEKDAGGNLVNPVGAGNGGWDYQEINGNDKFDYVTESRSIVRSNPAGTITAFFPKPWKPGCTVGTDCSEPHEPYLNLQYPATKDGSITMGWQAGQGTRRPKLTNNGKPSGTPIACNASSTVNQCTSNGYDEDGPLVEINAILNGVLYVEGEFEQTGNMNYFGSVLVEGAATKAGTPNFWFDERLIKGEWPPKEFRFPRAYVSSIQTD